MHGKSRHFWRLFQVPMIRGLASSGHTETCMSDGTLIPGKSQPAFEYSSKDPGHPRVVMAAGSWRLDRFDGDFLIALREHLPDPAQCLAGALFVFDQAEADVGIAIFAEADARAYRDLCLG